MSQVYYPSIYLAGPIPYCKAMEPQGSLIRQSVFIDDIISHVISNNMVYFKVHCHRNNSSQVEFLARRGLINEANGFEAIEKYINSDLPLLSRTELFLVDPLLVLLID